jgi:hypothetical protein
MENYTSADQREQWPVLRRSLEHGPRNLQIHVIAETVEARNYIRAQVREIPTPEFIVLRSRRSHWPAHH